MLTHYFAEQDRTFVFDPGTHTMSTWVESNIGADPIDMVVSWGEWDRLVEETTPVLRATEDDLVAGYCHLMSGVMPRAELEQLARDCISAIRQEERR